MTKVSVAIIEKHGRILIAKRVFMLMKNFLFILLLLVPHQISCSAPLLPEKITLPEHFVIEPYATGLKSVRAMAIADDGTLFAGSKNGDVYAITKSREVHVIDKGLTLPIGIDYYDNDLYVSDLSRIKKYRNVLKDLKRPPVAVIINDTLPDKRHHGGKFIKIGPDKKLYVNIGAPCNVCLEHDERFATISRMDLHGKNFEVYAKGVRNSVGFGWHPETKELWFTDNGRDWLGDDNPPDELNRSSIKGQHFGFPFVHGKQTEDPYYRNEKPDILFVPPEYELPAHAASLGMRFYTGDMFPDYYKDGIFIAEHGSWNRSEKIGYRISFVKIKNNRAVNYEVFASGWLEDDTVRGRPVDVEVAPDGALFVSDDQGGIIYRIYYNSE